MKMPEIGKIDRSIFDAVIQKNLGRRNQNVVIGPKNGVDAAAIRLKESEDEVMVIAEDPTFGMDAIMPDFGWSIVHICASDVAVLGVQPEYMTICLLLPPGIDFELFEGIWKQISEECDNLGISIVGWHTGVYPGIEYPLNGGATVFGKGKESDLTPPTNAREGDKILMTKGPALQAASTLARQAEKALSEEYGGEMVERAKEYFFDITVVEDSLILSEHVNAMHDATEGGLLNGVFELADASGLGCTIYEDRIEVDEVISKICDYFQINPLKAISEGTLLATCPPENVDRAIKSLEDGDIDCWEIGEMHDGKRKFVRSDGEEEKLKPVASDPFWPAYFETLDG